MKLLKALAVLVVFASVARADFRTGNLDVTNNLSVSNSAWIAGPINVVGEALFKSNLYAQGLYVNGIAVLTNVTSAGGVATNDARYLAALTNESDTLATVLGRGNNAAGQSATNFLDMQGTGVVAWGVGMSITSINATALGAAQYGYNVGSATIGGAAHGAQQRFGNGGTASIGTAAFGASQAGYNGGRLIIQNNANGAQQNVENEGGATTGGAGSMQRGDIAAGAGATNFAVAAVQLFDLSAGQQATTTDGGDASILLGAGTVSNRMAIVAGDGQESHGDGSITAGGGFYGSGAILTGDITAQDDSGNDTDVALTSPNGAQMLTLSGSDSGPFIYMGTSGDADTYAKFGAYDNVINFQSNGRGLNFRSDTVTSIISANHTNGNVGIGTNAPSTKLQVNGTATVEGLIQTSGGWDDLLFPVSSIYAVGLTDIEYLPQSNSINFKATCNTNFSSDNVWLVCQLSHSTKTNSAFISPHVHFVQTSATQTNVFFMRYKRYKIGEAVPATWTDLPTTNNLMAYTSGTIHQIAEGANINGPFGISENFDFKIWSRGGQATQLKSFDIHFQRDSLGSDLEYQKTF